MNTLDELYAVCRSPIEAAFLRALCDVCSEFEPCELDGGGGNGLWLMHDDHELTVVPAHTIVVGGLSYKLDFVFGEHATVVGAAREDWILGVELDGHEWHERTKEQAARDRQRDRALLFADVITIRFTGAEVYADAESCAREALRCAGHLTAMEQAIWSSGWTTRGLRHARLEAEASEEDRLP